MAGDERAIFFYVEKNEAHLSDLRYIVYEKTEDRCG